MYEAIVSAGMEAVEAIIAQIKEAKMASAEKQAAILARLNSSQAALDVDDAEAHATLALLQKDAQS